MCNVKVKGERVEQVKEMKYLGTMISSDGSMDSEVEQRIGMASRMVGAIGSTVLGRKELTEGTKLRVVNATVIPMLTYGCEALGIVGKTKGKNTGYTNESVKMDRGGIKVRENKESGS